MSQEAADGVGGGVTLVILGLEDAQTRLLPREECPFLVAELWEEFRGRGLEKETTESRGAPP